MVNTASRTTTWLSKIGPLTATCLAQRGTITTTSIEDMDGDPIERTVTETVDSTVWTVTLPDGRVLTATLMGRTPFEGPALVGDIHGKPVTMPLSDRAVVTQLSTLQAEAVREAEANNPAWDAVQAGWAVLAQHARHEATVDRMMTLNGHTE